MLEAKHGIPVAGQVPGLGENRIPVSSASVRQNHDGPFALMLGKMNLNGDAAASPLVILEVRELKSRQR